MPSVAHCATVLSLVRHLQATPMPMLVCQAVWYTLFPQTKTSFTMINRLFKQHMARIAPLIVFLGLASPSFAAAAIETLLAQIDEAAEQIEADVIDWRRDIHQNPELSNREFRTGALVAEHLSNLGMEVTTGVAHTGVIGVLRGSLPGPVVALRADMDALPVVEQTGLPFASTVTTEYNGKEVGVMHACGHDAHTAILMGVASILTELQEQIPGTIKFIFQPAEEGPPPDEDGGAPMMVAEGALLNPEPEAIFALHVGQSMTVGEAALRAGPMMAASQSMRITIKGRQTHGASPWSGVDPIAVGAQIVSALQTIVSRNVDITELPTVVTIGTFEAGTRHNIVPAEARLTGTIRTFDPEIKAKVNDRIREIATGVGAAMGAEVEVEIDPGLPVTANDDALTEFAMPVLRRVYGAERVFESPLITGAEDFAFFQQQIPGVYYFVGARSPDVPLADAVPNHSPFFTIDEAALNPSVRSLASIAVEYLASNAH